MSTAQAEANRTNSQNSTGPVTPEGKAASSRNAVKLGLFTMHDYVRPEDQPEYDELCASLAADLAPKVTAEHLLVTEIVGAAWKLRRCAKAESSLTGRFDPDPLIHDDPHAIRINASIERARARAHNILNRSMAELRRLQTNRAARNEILYQPAGTPNADGLADTGRVVDTLNAHARFCASRSKAAFSEMAARTEADLASFCKDGKPGPAQPETPRNAPCPCGSGEKHKRCCGKNAPPVLGKEAA